MKTLAERHADRIERKAANSADNMGGKIAGSVATAEAAFVEAANARARLSAEEQAELDEALRERAENGGFGGARSLAEAPDGSGETMAGVGVVNTRVVPASVIADEAGNGGGVSGDNWTAEGNAGWGDTPPATVAASPTAEAVEGNANGAALDAQAPAKPEKAKK